jgi:protein TonB
MQREKLNKWVVASTALHGALGMVVLFAPSLFSISSDASWGTNNGSGDGMNMRIVSNFSGIPLPSPPVVTENVAANESPGLSKSEPAPPPEPVKDAVPIPDPKNVTKRQPQKQAAAAPSRDTNPEPPPTQSNTVPYGQGGKPALQYGQFANGPATVGAGFGDGAFGERYGWYVQSMTRQISQNWLQSLVDNRNQASPRVYVRFVIARDGRVSGVEIQQASNIPSLDRSALRAIERSNPLPALPSDYRGSSVTVSFYFEYTR